MSIQSPRSRAGFTLIEVVLVLAIVAMMIAIIIPGVMQSGRRARARAERHEMSMLDGALEHYAKKNGKKPGSPVMYDDLKNYIEDQRSDLVKSSGRDVLGHPFGPFTVDSPITVPAQTAADLDSVADPAFWADYK